MISPLVTLNDHSVPSSIKDFIKSTPDFKINKYSSKGGFGQLYFGERDIIGDRVALKFYRLNGMYNPHEEAKILSTIRHKNILTILDAKVIDNDFAYFVTPEISGGDLHDYLTNNLIDTETALKIINGILEGLLELHKEPNNLLHRDLKPQNVLIEELCKTPCISDFGSVFKLPPGDEYVSASLYSFFYRPKEAMEEGEYYLQSDIYQVGVILYEILGGAFPFNNPIEFLSESKKRKYSQLSSKDKADFLEGELTNLVSLGKLLRLDTLPKYVDDKLKKIIKKATHIDRTKRYRNCANFIKDIFDYSKTAKSWYKDNNIIYCSDIRKNKFYRIIESTGSFILETSKNNINFRKKNLISSNLPFLLNFIHKD